AAPTAEVEAYLNDPPVSITAAELLRAYQNEAAADARFKDRKIWLTGQVLRFGRTPLGAPYVELAPGKGEAGLVRWHLDKGRAPRVPALKEEQEVTIEGDAARKSGNEVRVNDCRLLDRALVQAVTDEVRRRKGDKVGAP